MKKISRVLVIWLMALLSLPVVAQVQLPKGKGIWILDLPLTGNPSKVAKGIKNAGYNYVLIKYHNGSKIITANGAAFGAYAQEFHKQGLTVYIWGYNHALAERTDDEGNDVGFEAEAHLICDALANVNVDGYVFNWENEKEFRHPKSTTAKAAYERVYRMVKTVVEFRNSVEELKQKPIGWSSIPRLKHHEVLPVEQFVLAGIDFFQPQVYWKDIGLTPTAALDTCVAQWTARFRAISDQYHVPIPPIIPTGQTYKTPKGRMPTPDEVREFATVAKQRGFQAIDFFRYPQGKRDRWAMKEYDASLQAANDAWATTLANAPTAVQVEGPHYGFWWRVYHSPGAFWDWLGLAYWQGLLVLALTLCLGMTFLHLGKAVISEPWHYVGALAVAFLWTLLVWLMAWVVVLAVFYFLGRFGRAAVRRLRPSAA